MIAPPSRWAVRAAHLVSLVVLPSALWRVGLVLGFSMGGIEHGAPVHVTGWEAVYVLGLSVVTEGLALLTLGLVRPWGERFPRRFVLGLAGFGVIALTLLWGYAFRDFPNVGEGSDALRFSDAGHVLLVVCYSPLLLWAPLLAAVTLDYARRPATRHGGAPRARGARAWTPSVARARRVAPRPVRRRPRRTAR
jgi:hypothetical protein